MASLLVILVLFALSLPLYSRATANAFLQQEQPPLPRSLLQADNSSSCCSRLSAIGFSSKLPVVIIDSHGENVPHHVEKKISLCTCSNALDPIQEYQGIAMAKGRGTSSANFTKKSFQLNLISEKNQSKSENFPFLGMPKESDFILSGPEIDKTIGIRNWLTYNLAIAAGHYASQTVYTEVFLVEDGAPLSMKHYNGLYIGVEKVKRDKSRVDIQKLKAPDLSGGYIFLYDNDNINQGDVTFGPLKGWEHPFILKDPKQFPDNGAWLLQYLSDFETALFAEDWLQRTGNASYRSYIDMPAVHDFFLLVELTKSPDGYRGSTFMYKDVGKPLVPGPVWDYDESYGQCCGYPLDGWQRGGQSGPGTSGGSAISPEGWRFNICADPGRCIVEPRDGTAVWYRRMWDDPQYHKDVASRWAELRRGAWSDTMLRGMIDGLVVKIQDAAKRNYEKYYDVLVTAPGGKDGLAVWQGEVESMKEWLGKHVLWMDRQFLGLQK